MYAATFYTLAAFRGTYANPIHPISNKDNPPSWSPFSLLPNIHEVDIELDETDSDPSSDESDESEDSLLPPTVRH